jgi:hypothetical protein
VKSRGTPRFWAAYHALPSDVRTAAQKAYRLFLADPQHPSLQFKKVHAREPIYSVRVTLGYRAVGVLENDEATWFWIGSHADYEKLIGHAGR